ncbi:hypothetical protein ACFL02_01630, partial [Planctomycetota bacterium]
MSDLLSQLQQRLVGEPDKPGRPGDASPVSRLIALFGRKSDDISAADKAPDHPAHCEVHTCWGSLPRLIAALLNHTLKRPVLYITAHVPQADQAQDDLETFAGKNVSLLPAAETHESEPDPTSEIACERLR